MKKRKPEPIKAEDSYNLAGMESSDRERAEARAIAEGEELTAAMREPGRNVSGMAGEIERRSPLFYGTGENPLLF